MPTFDYLPEFSVVSISRAGVPLWYFPQLLDLGDLCFTLADRLEEHPEDRTDHVIDNSTGQVILEPEFVDCLRSVLRKCSDT
jgi:hypothetical protein